MNNLSVLTVEEYTSQVLDNVKADSLIAKGNPYLARLVHATVNVKEFGAVGDGINDDTTFIQNAIDSTLYNITTTEQGITSARHDMELYFPKGIYRTTSPLLVKGKNLKLIGSGKRGLQKSLETAPFTETNVLSTIYSDHTGACIKFDSQYASDGFEMRGVTLLGSTKVDTAVGLLFYKQSTPFWRNFTIEDCSITNYGSAFDTQIAGGYGGDPTWGVMRILNCNIMHNKFITKTTGGQWNNFVYVNNDSGQNGYAVGEGGLHLKAHAFRIESNVLEGQRDPIKVSGDVWRGGSIRNNYFESNVGDATIRLSSLRNCSIDNNFYFNQSTSEDIHLSSCSDITIDDEARVYMDKCSNIKTPEKMLSIPKTNTNFTGVFDVADALIPSSEAIYGTRLSAPNQPGLSEPHYGVPNSAGGATDSTATPYVTVTTSSLSVPQGDWVYFTVPITYKDLIPSTSQAYIVLQFNGATVYEGAIVTSPKINNKNQTVIICGGAKTTALTTSVTVNIYPFGISPPAGLMYIRGGVQTLQLSLGSAIRFRPFVLERQIIRGSAAPTAGTWEVGYKLRYLTPTAGGYEGLICTTAGTPGTWKGYGAIQA